MRSTSPAPRQRLGTREQRELDALPGDIETREARIEALRTALGDPQLYRAGADRANALRSELAGEEEGLAQAYARWEELEARSAPSA